MRINLIFDENSSLWEKDFEYNKLLVKTQLMYIKDCYKATGYIYLNRIYELLKLNWNPYEQNSCWIYERDGELEITITTKDNSPDKIWIDISND